MLEKITMFKSQVKFESLKIQKSYAVFSDFSKCCNLNVQGLLGGSILHGTEVMVDMREADLGNWNKLKKSRCASCSKLIQAAVFILCTLKLAKYQQGTRLK